MTLKISGIEAAWREKEGVGTLTVMGDSVLYFENGYSVDWNCKTHREANKMIELFRAATKYPGSRIHTPSSLIG